MTDAPRRVYRVPIALTVRTSLFVLADDMADAQRQAKLVDLNDYFSFHPTKLYVSTTDGKRRLRFDDVEVSVVDTAGTTALSLSTYSPRNHPDFVRVPRR